MTPRLVYVIGPPGSGKSTLMAGLLDGLIRVPRSDYGLPRDELYRNGILAGVELGRHRAAFSGTDALAMNIHPVACRWLAHDTDAPVVYGEGQRLSTQQFLLTALKAGRTVELVQLDPPPEVAAARRAARGSRQNPTWVRGATTRVTRLAGAAREWSGVRVTVVTDHGSASDTAARLRAELDLTTVEVPA